MEVGAGELGHRIGVGAQAQPAQAVEDHLHRRLAVAGAIGVFDPDQEFAARVASI
jgi:hypothetical protein